MSETNKLTTEMMEYLGCPCRYVDVGESEQELVMEIYEEAAKRGVKEGFVPMLVGVDDTLWECLQWNADEAGNGTTYSKENVEAYRKKMLSAPVEDGKKVLDRMTEEMKEWMEEFGDEEFEDDLAEEGEMIEEGSANTAFLGFEYSSGIILAEIPVKNPWEVFAWLPFGGWNDCPDTPVLMAVSKYWYEQYGAVPASVTHDVLEYKVPKPVEGGVAMDLAMEQIAFCPEEENPAALADSLTKSTVWFFWWD